MMTLMIAAAATAAQPTAPAPADQDVRHLQQAQPAEHKAMDCCKDCCKDMATKPDGHAAQ